MQTALPLSPRQLLIEVLMDLNEAEMHSRVLTSHKRHTYTSTHTTVSSPYKHNANDVFYMNTQTLKYSCSVYKNIYNVCQEKKLYTTQATLVQLYRKHLEYNKYKLGFKM